MHILDNRAFNFLLSSFLAIALADSLATLALFLPFLFLPDLAKSSGIEADKVYLHTQKTRCICTHKRQVVFVHTKTSCICTHRDKLYLYIDKDKYEITMFAFSFSSCCQNWRRILRLMPKRWSCTNLNVKQLARTKTETKTKS